MDIKKTEIDLPCPHCGRKSLQKIGRLERDPTITCSACHKPFKVEASQLRTAVQKIEKSFADLKRTLGRLGKR